MKATADFNSIVLYGLAAFAGGIAWLVIQFPMRVAPPEWLSYVMVGLLAVTVAQAIRSLRKRLDEDEAERIEFQQRMWKVLLAAPASGAVFTRRKPRRSAIESATVHRDRKKEGRMRRRNRRR